jgi:hypothetical protein
MAIALEGSCTLFPPARENRPGLALRAKPGFSFLALSVAPKGPLGDARTGIFKQCAAEIVTMTAAGIPALT